MESATAESIDETSVLNDLIVATLDNVDEYHRAIFTLEQRLLALHGRLGARLQAVEWMQRHVQAVGGQPAHSRSALAAAFAMRLSKRFLVRNDSSDDGLLQDAERGEESLKKQLQAKLKKKLLSPKAQQVVEEAYERIVAERSRLDAPAWIAPVVSLLRDAGCCDVFNGNAAPVSALENPAA